MTREQEFDRSASLEATIDHIKSNLLIVRVLNQALPALIADYERTHPEVHHLEISLSVDLDKQTVDVKEAFMMRNNDGSRKHGIDDEHEQDEYYDSSWERVRGFSDLPTRTSNEPKKEQIASPMRSIFSDLEKGLGITLESLPLTLISVYPYSTTLMANKNQVVEVDDTVFPNTYVNRREHKKQASAHKNMREAIKDTADPKYATLRSMARDLASMASPKRIGTRETTAPIVTATLRSKPTRISGR